MRLHLELHLDHVGMVVGGGYAVYDADGDLMSSVAEPCWAVPMTLADAAQRMVALADRDVWIQQVFPFG